MGSIPATDLASLFECPVCFDYVLPPIFQCQAGHLVCSECRPKLDCCPTCRGPLGSIRNLAMEKLAETVFFPCKYSSNGCTTRLLYNGKTEHEHTCEFRPCVCPIPRGDCKWQGSLEQVMPHIASTHKRVTTLKNEDIVFLAVDINLAGRLDWVMMQYCFGHDFVLTLEKQKVGHNQQILFFSTVQIIASREQAKKFTYRLELTDHQRHLIWKDAPRSVHEEAPSAVNHEGFVFDERQAKFFAKDGNLAIISTIYRN